MTNTAEYYYNQKEGNIEDGQGGVEGGKDENKVREQAGQGMIHGEECIQRTAAGKFVSKGKS